VRATLQRYSTFGLDDVLRGDISVDEAWTVLMHAPRDSPVISAIADDPFYAQPDAKVKPPTLAQFSPERETLARIDNKLGALLANLIALGGGKPPRIEPHPWPESASQRAAAAAERDAAVELHDRLVGQLIRPPGRRVRDETGLPEMPGSGNA
jgi:hypothetical protein